MYTIVIVSMNPKCGKHGLLLMIVFLFFPSKKLDFVDPTKKYIQSTSYPENQTCSCKCILLCKCVSHCLQ